MSDETAQIAILIAGLVTILVGLWIGGVFVPMMGAAIVAIGAFSGPN